MVFCAAMDVTALAFAANATILPQERLPGIYAGGATAILIGAGMLFLSTHVRWYEALPGPEQRQNSDEVALIFLFLALSGQSIRARVCPLSDNNGLKSILAGDSLSAYNPQATF